MHRPQLMPGCTSRAGRAERCQRPPTRPPHIAPGNVGIGNVTLKPDPLPEVEMVQRARAHTHQHFARSGFRRACIFIAQHLRAAVLVTRKPDGFS